MSQAPCSSHRPHPRGASGRTAAAAGLLCILLAATLPLQAQNPAPHLDRVVEFRPEEACTPRGDFTVRGARLGTQQGERVIRLSHAKNPRAMPGPPLRVLSWSDAAIRVAYPADQGLDLRHRHYVGIYEPDGDMASNLVPVEFCRPVLPAVPVPPPLPAEVPPPAQPLP